MIPDLITPRQPCPGCDCRRGTYDADLFDCACDGPCTTADDWGPDKACDPDLYGLTDDERAWYEETR